MKKKERRIRFLLKIFFVLTGLYIFAFKAWTFYLNVPPDSYFSFRDGSLPIFELVLYVFTGLACWISAWSLQRNASWENGWCMFTFGLLLYGSLNSMGPAIYQNPVRVIPMVIIILVVLQSFPFLITNNRKYP